MAIDYFLFVELKTMPRKLLGSYRIKISMLESLKRCENLMPFRRINFLR